MSSGFQWSNQNPVDAFLVNHWFKKKTVFDKLSFVSLNIYLYVICYPLPGVFKMFLITSFSCYIKNRRWSNKVANALVSQAKFDGSGQLEVHPVNPDVEVGFWLLVGQVKKRGLAWYRPQHPLLCWQVKRNMAANIISSVTTWPLIVNYYFYDYYYYMDEYTKLNEEEKEII